MSNKLIIVNKKTGQTPLDCINEVKAMDSSLLHLPITYAGRLDPLASGVLVLLVGDECLKKDEYLKLSKEYEVDILFGFATDTYDVMGKVVKSTQSENELFERPIDSTERAKSKELFKMVWPSFQKNSARRSEDLLNRSFDEAIVEFTGKFSQAYPPYSSRTINGKPLFQWAREERLSEIEIPSHDVFVEKIEIIKEDFISGDNLLEKIKNDISKVKGDFRQSEIIEIWEKTLQDKKEEKYKIIKLRISCGGGVYVRGIANSIGEKVGIPALALRIVRIKVGEYHT